MVTDNGGGHFITYFHYQGQSSVQSLGADHTATSCCNACAKLANCQGTYYTTGDSQCRLFVAIDGSTCANFRQNMIAQYFTSNDAPLQVVLSNGLCGQWQNGGTIG
jgi:cyanophycinase-like exopeptidase